MTAAAWIALVFGGTSLVLNLLALAVGYGVLRGTVVALAGRVTALEAEIKAVGELGRDLIKVSTQLEGLMEQFKDLRASIRWMERPADYSSDDLKRQGGR